MGTNRLPFTTYWESSFDILPRETWGDKMFIAKQTYLPNTKCFAKKAN